MNPIIVALCAVPASALVLAVMGVRVARRERAKLGRAMTHDHITGLPNRDGLTDALDSALGSEGSGQFAVFAIEIDKLTSVNTTYGHEVGDALLLAITRQLTRALNTQEQAVRYGGPQFIVLSPRVTSGEEALDRARELNRALRIPYQIGMDQIRISPRIGIATGKGSDDGAEDLITDALLAANSTNNHDADGVKQCELYKRSSPSTILPKQRRNAALDNEKFRQSYLPVIELDTNRIVGVEALLRWADPARGILPPSEFLDILERTGLMVPVGSWVINEVSRQIAEWDEQFPAMDLVITLNVSRSQLAHPDLFDTLMFAVQAAGITADRLCLEVSEDSLTTDVDTTWTILRRAKDAGFKLAIDDFGVGFSSFANLRNFQLDILKVSRSFIDGLGTSREDEAIVQQLVALSHALGVVPVAEGVETADQAQRLQAMRCDFAQGYWFSKPEPPTTIVKLLERGKITPGGDQRRSINWSGSS